MHHEPIPRTRENRNEMKIAAGKQPNLIIWGNSTKFMKEKWWVMGRRNGLMS